MSEKGERSKRRKKINVNKFGSKIHKKSRIELVDLEIVTDFSLMLKHLKEKGTLIEI
jgi:hypothetical protein